MSAQLFRVPLPESKLDPAARKTAALLTCRRSGRSTAMQETNDLRHGGTEAYPVPQSRRTVAVWSRRHYRVHKEGLTVLLLEVRLSYSPPRSPAGCNRKGER
jgi:hypothetical protein